MNSSYDTVDIFVYLWKNRKFIIFVSIIAFVLSLVVSVFLKNKYKSVAIAYPTKYFSLPMSVYKANYNQEDDPMLIGEEEDSEKMIQLLNSDYIFETIVAKFDLIKHYNLDPNDPKLRFKLKKMYSNNVNIKKTKYTAVQVEVIDKNPQIAAKIANEILKLFDTLMLNIQKERAQEVYESAKKAYEKQLLIVNKLEDSLKIYRKKGIYLFGIDLDRINEAYWKSLGRGTLNSSADKKFQAKFDTLTKYGELVRSLEKEWDISMSILLDLRTKMLRAESNLNDNYTRKYIVSEAKPADKKFWPKRSLIVLFSTLAGAFIAVFILLIGDLIAEIKRRIVSNNITQ